MITIRLVLLLIILNIIGPGVHFSTVYQNLFYTYLTSATSAILLYSCTSFLAYLLTSLLTYLRTYLLTCSLLA